VFIIKKIAYGALELGIKREQTQHKNVIVIRKVD